MRKMLSWRVGVDNLFRFDRSKSGAHTCPRDVEKESASYRHTHYPLNNPAEENVDGISQNLRPDNSHSQLPSPPSVLEPTYPSERERYREQKEQESHRLAQGRKLIVGVRIQNPHAVKSGWRLTRLVPAMSPITAPKSKKTPIAVMPRGGGATGGVARKSMSQFFNPHSLMRC